jgi:hypothetical protein
MRTHVSYIHASAAALSMTASIFMRESWYDAKIRSLHQGKLFYDLPLKIRVPDNHLLRFAFHPMKICKLVKNRVGSYPANAMSPILSFGVLEELGVTQIRSARFT